MGSCLPLCAHKVTVKGGYRGSLNPELAAYIFYCLSHSIFAYVPRCTKGSF